MPAAISYPMNPNSNEWRIMESVFETELKERQARTARHWQYYDGAMPRPLKVESDGVNDNVLLCKVDQVADKVVSFLMGSGVRFDVGGDDDTDADDDQVKALWEANKGESLMHNIALSGVMSGHCWARVEPREGELPRIVSLNPEHCTAFWQVDDIERVLWYRLQFVAGAEGKRVDYVRGQWDGANDSINHDAEGWCEITYLSRSGGSWMRQGDPLPLPWPFPPVVDWQNMPRPHAYYGTDDVSKAVALNDAVNLVASSYNRILKHHGFPKTIGIGMEPAQVVASEIGGFWTVNKPASEAQIFNLEMQSDLANAREFLALLMREIWQSTRMVDPQSIKDTIGSLTNFGLRVIYSDALRKTETKRLLYGEGLVEVTRRALAMAGIAVPEVITAVWPECLPTDTSEEVKSGLEELAAGVISRQTYQERHDIDPEKEAERLEEEKASEGSIGDRLLQAFERGAPNGRERQAAPPPRSE